ncbi:MAG: LamG domain-containing protein [candidate division Zixibacteria bacterium]|nr:LamG domain-containing protein [candidate division Zixibacteria bacterium]
MKNIFSNKKTGWLCAFMLFSLLFMAATDYFDDINASGDITVGGTVDGVDVSDIAAQQTINSAELALKAYTADVVPNSIFTETDSSIRGTGAGTYEEVKNNLSAAVAPTANEDSGDGYSVGSRWIDTTADKEYSCLDATLTAAVWTDITDAGGAGTVDTSGTPIALDYARFTDANTIEGRSYAELKTDISLNNVENTALSTWGGTSNITILGTVTSGGLGTGSVIGTPTMTLGSDVDLDIYYRSSGILARLAKGTGLQVLRMNAGATGLEWAAASGGATIDDTTWTGANWTSTTNGISADKLETALEEVAIRYDDRASQLALSEHMNIPVASIVSSNWTANSAIISVNDDELDAGWQFSSGALLVDSINSYDLTNNGTVTSVAGGKFGNYASFDGSTQWLSHADDAIFDISTGDFTFAAWVYIDTLGSARVIASHGGVGNATDTNGWTIWVSSSNFLTLSIYDGSMHTMADTGALSASTWYHVVGTRTGSTATLYRDAVSVASNGSFTYNGDSTSEFRIGKNHETSFYWPGRIDEAMWWKGAGFSSEEVTALYNSGTGSYYTGSGMLKNYVLSGAKVNDPWYTIVTGNYTATPASTSTITMSETEDFAIGKGVRYTDGSGTFYAIVTAITEDTTLTIAGAPLDTGDDLTALAVCDASRVTQVDLFISSTYGDGTDTDLLASDMNSYFKWQGGKAYLVTFSGIHKTVDTGTEPKINIQINNANVSTNDTNAGIQLGATATWVDNSAVAISTTNYDINRGEELEINCSAAGGTGDAADLTTSLIFVLE